jgi:drug/metabolite transporter (DMT)-like permease
MIFTVFLTFFIWSTTFTIGKSTLEYCPPLFLTSFRMILAGVLLLSFLFFFKRKEFSIKKHQLFPLILLGITSVYLANAFEFWGLQYLSAAKACFIYSLSPFLSALFSYFQFKEKMTRKKMLGLLIGFVGFLPVLFSQSGAEELIGGLGVLSWPELALIGATVTSVYGWILLRKLGKDEGGMSPLMSNGTSMMIGGCFALVHSMLVENWNPLPVQAANVAPFMQGVLLMIVISNLLCYNLYGWLLKKFTATFLSFAGLMTPLFAAFFGWLVLGETVSWTFFLSMGILFFGLWLVYAEELKLGYILKAKQAAKIPAPVDVNP